MSMTDAGPLPGAAADAQPSTSPPPSPPSAPAPLDHHKRSPEFQARLDAEQSERQRRVYGDAGSQEGEQRRTPSHEQPDNLTSGVEPNADAERAVQEIRALSAPQSPADYRVELPPTFKPPEGIDFKFHPDDPMVAQARDWAHKHRLGQDAFSEALALYAAEKTGAERAFIDARQNEIAKLGAAATQRVSAMNTWLTGMLGADGARVLSGTFWTADIVQQFEKLAMKMSGGTNFSHAHREAPESGVSEEAYGGMSFREKMDLARSAKGRR